MNYGSERQVYKMARALHRSIGRDGRRGRLDKQEHGKGFEGEGEGETVEQSRGFLHWAAGHDFPSPFGPCL